MYIYSQQIGETDLELMWALTNFDPFSQPSRAPLTVWRYQSVLQKLG